MMIGKAIFIVVFFFVTTQDVVNSQLSPILPQLPCRLEQERTEAELKDALSADDVSTTKECKVPFPILTKNWPFDCGYFCTCVKPNGLGVCYRDRYDCCQRCQKSYHVCLCKGYSKYYCYQQALNCLCSCNKTYYCKRVTPFPITATVADISDE